MRILICPVGSHGDVLPMMALAKALQARGHDARLYGAVAFEPLAKAAGLPFVPFGSDAAHQALLRDPAIIHSRGALLTLVRAMEPFLQPVHDALIADILPGETIVVGSTLAVAARLAGEVCGVPTVTVHLSPACLRSAVRPPRFGARAPWPGVPLWLRHLQLYLADRLVVDPSLGAVVNRRRTALGLPPMRRVVHRWYNQADLIVAMFPAWFAAPAPDWPAQVRLTGFPLPDRSQPASLSPELQAFLAQGAPPIGFTAGTASAASGEFYAVSAEACRQSGWRGILLTPHADQVPHKLPEGVIQADWAPFPALLPRLAAFVHHGGIGSLSEGFRAGVPQLIRPMAFDQFDNTARAVQLGVAAELLPERYKVGPVIAALDTLARDPAVRQRCTQLAQRVKDDGIDQACEAILASAVGDQGVADKLPRRLVRRADQPPGGM
jgi:UDP:flavonoid glycosyltransferase YjiC (YdhE family)